MKYIYIFSKVSTKIPRKPNTGQVSSLSTISGTFHIYIDVGMSFSNSNTHNTIPSDLSKSRNASQRKQESNLFRRIQDTCAQGGCVCVWLCVCTLFRPKWGGPPKRMCARAHIRYTLASSLTSTCLISTLLLMLLSLSSFAEATTLSLSRVSEPQKMAECPGM